MNAPIKNNKKGLPMILQDDTKGENPFNILKMKPIPQAFVLATILTTLLIFITVFIAKTPLNWFETAAVFFSFGSTWLCVRQSRFNYWLGIVSTALLSYVFFQAGLFGSMALNLYLVPTLIYGWFSWGKDSNTKPVKHVSIKSIPVYILATILTYIGANYIITLFGGTMGGLDSWLLIGSILAQYLLDRKKIETWFIWMSVNVISIYVYFNNGLYLLAIQFLLFLVNAVYAWFQWRKDLIK